MISGLLGAAVSALAWWIVFDFDAESYFGYGEHQPATVVGVCLLLGAFGGLWLGRDQPNPFRWMYCGAVLAGCNPMAILWFSPDLAFGWPMIVFPSASGFAAAIGAKIAAAQPREAGSARSSAWFVFVLVAAVFGIVLWAGKIAVTNLQPAVPFLLSGLVIVQEVRILRLKRRLAEKGV